MQHKFTSGKMKSRVILCVVVVAVVQVSRGFAMAMKENPKIFFYKERDKMLTGHVIATHQVTSPIDCSILCISNIKCKSHDYNPGDGACKLNNATSHNNAVQFIASPGNMHYEPQVARSCLDLLRLGASENGIYTITDTSGDSYQVFCDLNSEPRSAWTLILSMAFKHRAMAELQTSTYLVNAPLNSNSPNWQLYRQTFARMSQVSSLSTHVRATTGFDKYGIDFTDYLRAKIADVNILTFLGREVCKTVEYINIRGHKGISVTVPFWQVDGQNILHTDSTATLCVFKPNSGAVLSEDNFGLYEFTNPNFRGSENAESTTQYWFGGYLS